MIKELHSKLLSTKTNMKSSHMTNVDAIIILSYTELTFILQLVETACLVKFLSKGDSK